MGFCLGRACFVIRNVEVVLLLLSLLLYAVQKRHSINCTICNDPSPIHHHFYQHGDFTIGEIVSQVLEMHGSPSFLEQPTQTLIGEPV